MLEATALNERLVVHRKSQANVFGFLLSAVNVEKFLSIIPRQNREPIGPQI
jgi:hypothetical protein